MTTNLFLSGICGLNNWIKGVLDVFSIFDPVYCVTESCFVQYQLVNPRSLCQWVWIAPVFILCNIFLLKY